MFDRAKFHVNLSIDKVTRIPYASGHLFVRWHVTDSPRPDAHGKTVNREIHQSEAYFDYKTNFNQRISVRTQSKLLKPCTLKLEVVWIPDDGRSVNLGVVNLDLAQYALPPKAQSDNINYKEENIVASDMKKAEYGPFGDESPEHVHPYDAPLLYILYGSRTNCLLQVRIQVTYISGNADYIVPEFTGPAINFHGDANADSTNNGKTSGLNAGAQSRDKIRQLREAVLKDLRKDGQSREDADSHNLDNLLMGKSIRVKSDIPDEEFKKYNVLDLGTVPDIVCHNEPRPYEEIEIRDSFVTWNLSR